jgi:hypothetical protein
MTYYPNTTIPNNLYAVANATTQSSPFVDEFLPRDPTIYDINYPTQKKWLNTTDGTFWELQGFSSAGGTVTADWIKIGSIGLTETLTGNTGGPVPATANNINVVGDGVYITTVGTPATSTLTIEPAGGIATLFTEDVGTASAMGGNLNVFGGTGINTHGSGNTITINGNISQAAASSSLTNIGEASFNSSHFTVDSNGYVDLIGGAATTGFTVDAHTAPGTIPVIPNPTTGLVTVTGGQVAAGTTANVIETNSLAANTYTIDIQRSQAVASSTVGDNGVSHFNSGIFSVDANGFVNLSTSFYQTGTFTPVLSFGGLSTGITYSVGGQLGEYTRVGNVVHYALAISLTNKGSATGTAGITGFPFVCGTVLGTNNNFMNITNVNLPVNTYQTFGIIEVPTSTFIPSYSSGSPEGFSTNMDNTNFNNNTDLLMQGFIFLT